MDDDLLSEILVVEQTVRQSVVDLERQETERLEALKRQIEAEFELETVRLQDETARALGAAERSARKEAADMLAKAHAYAERIGSLTNDEMDRAIVPYLERLRPEGEHDRQDEQT